MPILDFKEIPVPTSGATRDQFEMFAREFMEFLGMRVIVGPDRGPDAGRDLIVEEIRTGVAGETRIKWLVSCKHKAHSGASVTVADESDINDRVLTHNCGGFLCAYSTIPSSGLAAKLNATALPFEVRIYDPEIIERHILSSSEGVLLAERFFPSSIARWKREDTTPVKIFSDELALLCKYCEKNLLLPEPHGNVVIWTTLSASEEHTKHLYWCCKGHCDRELNEQFRREGLVDGWKDIQDLVIPAVYIQWVMGTINILHSGTTHSIEAFDSSKELFLNLFPFVSREVTESERERIKILAMIPDYLGGMGY